MLRVLVASLFAAAVALSADTVSADVRIHAAKSNSHPSGQYAKRYHRQLQTTAIAIPRCRLVHRKSYHVHWRGLACPKIAWAGSAPRQPWSYEVFRRHTQWEQKSMLWQSHFRPSRSHSTIYWGY